MTENNKPKTIIVDVIPPEATKEESYIRLEELENLVKTYGGIVVVKVIQKRGVPDYSTYIGQGKLAEIHEIVKDKGISLIIINNLLKPKQLYNLEEYFKKEKVKIWDRIDLILEIFDKHAQNTEAKLQIELSKIRHMGPRIYGMGLELMRQEGAVGVRSGQGESNIVIMKRHLKIKEQRILEKIKQYENIRANQRERRKRQNFKTAALVGYTNAGKSSLLKALTNKNAYIADKLFATLDTKYGKIYLKQTEKIDENGKFISGEELLLTDTIGFIQDLPPDLIKAFKATLSETINADLILHVIDCNDPYIDRKVSVVEEILKDLGLEDRKKIYVFNKVDLLQDMGEATVEEVFNHGIIEASKDASWVLGWENYKKAKRKKINFNKINNKYKNFEPVFVSATTKKNFPDLINKVIKTLYS